MERDNWILNILNSTNGMAPVVPNEDLLQKIRQKINRQKTVSLKTVWLAAASIVVLVVLNFSIIKSKTEERSNLTVTSYLESSLNQSNQFYQ